MNPQIPQTDSIQELAEFWQTHDLTEFDHQLELVKDNPFAGNGRVLEVSLTSEQAAALEQLAESRGVEPGILVQEWVASHVQSSG